MDGRRRLSSPALNSQPDIAIAARKGRKRHMALWNGLDRLNERRRRRYAVAAAGAGSRARAAINREARGTALKQIKGQEQ